MKAWSDHELEQLRRSVAMLPPGEQVLGREVALSLLKRLQVLTHRIAYLEDGLRLLLDDVQPDRR